MKFRTPARRKAVRERVQPTSNQAPVQAAPPTDGVKMSWVRACVNVAVENAEARLRAEAERRDNGPPTAREKAVLKAVSDALLAERRLTQNRQGGSGGGQADLAPTVNKLEQMMGLAVDTLESKIDSLQAEVAELRQALLTLNSRPTNGQPRKLLITHADGTTSTLTETLANEAEAKDDDFLPPPPQP